MATKKSLITTETKHKAHAREVLKLQKSIDKKMIKLKTLELEIKELTKQYKELDKQLKKLNASYKVS